MKISDWFKPDVQKLAQKKDIKGLIRALQYKGDFGVRADAVWNLGRVGDESAIESLVQFIGDIDLDAHNQVIYNLRDLVNRIGTTAIPPLLHALEDEDNEIARDAVAENLVRIGEPAVKSLILALKHRNHYVRKSVAWSLAKAMDKRFIEPLVQALMDAHWQVREGAAYALEKIGWVPQTDQEKAKYLIAAREWEELLEIGQPAFEVIGQVLKDKENITDLNASIVRLRATIK